MCNRQTYLRAQALKNQHNKLKWYSVTRCAVKKDTCMLLLIMQLLYIYYLTVAIRYHLFYFIYLFSSYRTMMKITCLTPRP